MKKKGIYLILCLSIFKCFGQTETRNVRAYANHLLIPGSYIQSHDDKFINSGTWITGFNNYSNKAIVELGLDEDKHLTHTTPIKICAKFDVLLVFANQTSTTLTAQQLDINYNPADLSRYRDKAEIIFPNVYKVKVYNVSISYCSLATNCNSCSTPYSQNDVYLQAEISTNRIYSFTFSATYSAGDITDSITVNDQLKITWPFMLGATEYELEYAFVDDYSPTLGTYLSPSAIIYDLDHDATRIVTTNNHYYIPLTYEHGYIVYRLRPIGRNVTLDRMEGSWYPATGSGTVSSTLCKRAIDPQFPSQILNWESAKTFAEFGKTGVGVNFLDALGFERQSLARLNTESKTIVRSTLYDFYGRPSINFLPSPVSGLNLGYRFGLNIYTPSASTVSSVFDKLVFENCGTNSFCSPSGFTLNPGLSAGAANYFSPQNINKEKYQGYLPDAEGVPYTQVKYTNDGLNRVARQTLPGKLHQLGSAREIKLTYTNPCQVELDRLFGSEAGEAKYYLRNSTTDPNGQVSLNYYDMYGRIVATSLKGSNPTNVDPLTNQTGTLSLLEEYHNTPINQQDPLNHCKEVNSTIEVFSTSSEKYIYQATWGTFFSNCDQTCYQCVYDITLSITDECGNEIFDYDGDYASSTPTPPGYKGKIGFPPPYSATTCSNSIPSSTFIAGTSLSAPVTIVFPRAGKYKVYKKICVSEAPINDYTEKFLSNDACNIDKCSIFNNILNSTSFTGCSSLTCNSCTSSILSHSSSVATSTYQTFNNTGPLNGGLESGSGTNGSTQAVYTQSMTPQEVSEALENCSVYCTQSDRCSIYQRLMEADFYPNSGQFAATNSLSPTWSLSVFNPTNTLHSSHPTWSTTANSYSNAIGQLDYVQLNNSVVTPTALPLADFVTNYRKSWAKTFMQYHPENCKKFFYCTLLNNSLNYDDELTKLTHFDKACASGYLFPINYSSYSSYKPSSSCSSSSLDPITSLAAFPQFSTAISTFSNEITGNFRGSGRDIYEYVSLQSNTLIANNTTTDYVGMSSCSADDQWSSFQDFYLNAKEILYQKLLVIFLASPSSFGYSASSCASLPPNAVSHFPDPQGFLLQQYPTTGTNTPITSLYTVAISPPNYTNTSAVTNYTNTLSQFMTSVMPTASATANSCTAACSSYTALWHIDLTNACPAYGVATSTIQNKILTAMVGVCELGCDYNTNLLGASSTPPGTVYTLPATSQTVSNFQQILDYYLGTAVCNSIVINKPKLYPAVGATVTLNNLTSCKCDIILEVAHAFATATPLPSGVTYEWQLFQYMYGYDLVDYNRLKCICNAATNHTWTTGHSWTQIEQDALLNYTLAVDPQLTCNSCLTCTNVVNAINSLTLPVTSTLASIIDKINSSPGNQIFALNSLNQLFGQHALQTYIDLYNDCSSFTLNTSYTFKNTLTQQAQDLFTYLNATVGGKKLLKNRIMSFCTDDKFYLSSLYSGNLPTIPGYSFTASTNSNSLSIFIQSATQTIATILLIKPIGYSGSWNDLKYLSDFMAFSPPPLSSGPVYGFKVTAVDQSWTSIILTGSITSMTWPIGYLSQGTGTMIVPSLCPSPPPVQHSQCAINLINNALTQAQQQYSLQIAAVTTTFQNAWRDFCFNSLSEVFTRSYSGADEYNYTLYYYDQAGNLQRTVPPNGVDAGLLSAITSPIASSVTLLPAYSSTSAVDFNYVNDYHYDSYNNLNEEKSIDGGKTTYYHDEVGRLVASQNAQQLASTVGGNQYFSYTLYDGIGRVKEVGQALVASNNLTVFAQNNYGAFETVFTSTNTTRSQVTQMYYDRAITTASVLSAFTGSLQLNLRNRVAFVKYMETYSGILDNYDHATYYSYDDHGNVVELVQHNKQLDLFNQGLRSIKYEFELISGNMIKATYQFNKPDQFMHKYYYDPDNRLSEVFTSRDDINWDRDAKYFYYEHGPLARIERGDKKVQGTDYFYTIHGWIKGINSDALSKTSDAGKDGTAGSTYLSAYANIHQWFGSDAMAYSLNYYNTSSIADYKPIKTFTTGDLNPLMSLANFTNSANPFYLDNNSPILSGDGADLFNGNISSMTTSFIDKDPSNSISNNSPFPQLSAYRYDQLNRLTKMKTFRSYSASTLTWNPGNSSNYDDAYRMSLSYDNNGNILSLYRNGPGTNIVSGSSLNMDDLQYTYYNLASGFPTNLVNLNSNKLMCLDDQVSSSNYSEDIDAFGCSNQARRYYYDEIGNLTKDNAEFIDNIDWTVDRKVRRITRNATAMLAAGVTKSDIEYEYNAQRKRVVKIVKPRDPSTKALKPAQDWIYTYYVYDATGNVLATYDRTASQVSGTTYKDQLSLFEHDLYGAERLGLALPANTLATWSYSFNSSCGGSNCRTVPTSSPTPDATIAASGYKTERNLGYKDLELDNHLGNVISTVSDRKIQSTFGPGTCVKVFDFQNGVPPDWDIGRNNMTLSTSGGSLVCTMQTVSYISGINPQFGINLTAGMVYQFEFDFDPGSLTISDGLYIVPFDYNGISLTTGAYFWNTGSVPPAGHYTYTYTPSHTGSTYTTQLAFNTGSGTHFFKVDNIKLCPAVGAVASYSADIISNTDYYAFGQKMAGRTWSASDYRYDFNSKESDKEVSNGYQDYGFRVNDTRIGRFFSVDPLRMSYPELTPYQFASNRPIDGVDLDGLEWKNAKGQLLSKTQLKAIKVYIFYYTREYQNAGFESQTMKQVASLEKEYGENAIAVSELSTETQFAQDWQDMDGNIQIVRLNTHGTGQTLFIKASEDEYLTSTGTGSTEVHENQAYAISDLKQPKGDISGARLEINSCHSDQQNGYLYKGSMKNLSESFAGRFGFATVRGTAGSVNYYSNGSPYPSDGGGVAGWVRGSWNYYHPTFTKFDLNFNFYSHFIMRQDNLINSKLTSKFGKQETYQKRDNSSYTNQTKVE